jgi:hypothetical protein
VPDVRSPEFRNEARRQSLAVASSAHEADDQAFIDAVSDRAEVDQRMRGNPGRQPSCKTTISTARLR